MCYVNIIARWVSAQSAGLHTQCRFSVLLSGGALVGPGELSRRKGMLEECAFYGVQIPRSVVGT